VQGASVTVNIGKVSGESAPGGVESAFRWYLNCAITLGSRPSRDAGLGLGTCDAIDRVARDHPESDVRLIADAYDAFAREHGVADSHVARDEPLPTEPPKRLVARKNKPRRT
jgi:hypothetical protein